MLKRKCISAQDFSLGKREEENCYAKKWSLSTGYTSNNNNLLSRKRRISLF
jgi:hypothetical protein